MKKRCFRPWIKLHGNQIRNYETLPQSLPGVTIHVEEVDKIPDSESGKVRIAIRGFPLF